MVTYILPQNGFILYIIMSSNNQRDHFPQTQKHVHIFCSQYYASLNPIQTYYLFTIIIWANKKTQTFWRYVRVYVLRTVLRLIRLILCTRILDIEFCFHIVFLGLLMKNFNIKLIVFSAAWK